MKSSMAVVLFLVLVTGLSGVCYGREKESKVDEPVLRVDMYNYTIIFLSNMSEVPNVQLSMSVHIPEKSGLSLYGSDIDSKVKIIKLEDDTGKVLLSPDSRKSFSSRYIDLKDGRLRSDAFGIYNLYDPDEKSKNLVFEGEFNVAKKITFKKVTIKPLSRLKSKTLEFDGGKAEFTRDGNRLKVASSYELDPTFFDASGKRVMLSRGGNGNGTWTYCFREFPEKGSMVVEVPRKVSLKKLNLSYNIELFPQKTPDAQDNYFKDRNKPWKELITQYKDYQDAPLLEGSKLTPSILRIYRKRTVYAYGKKVEYLNFGVPSLELEFEAPHARVGKDFTPPFKNVVFFKPVKIVDDLGKNLIADNMGIRCSESSGNSSSSGPHRDYDISVNGIGSPSPEAKTIKHFEIEIYCQDNDNNKRRVPVVFNDIPLHGVRR